MGWVRQGREVSVQRHRRMDPPRARRVWSFHDRLVLDDEPEPAALTVVNFSGGVQSTAMLLALIRGEIARPARVVVLNADPGMEDPRTYDYVAHMFALCRQAGVEARTCPGENLYADLVDTSRTGRLDLPPFYVENDDGSRGRLLQKCTKKYKIEPMSREIRRIMARDLGIPTKSTRIREGSVEKWLGFSADERHRISMPDTAFVRFYFPLWALDWSKQDCVDYLRRSGMEPPPRSVCNACPANSPSYLATLRRERPDAFAKTRAVDEAVRDLSRFGVTPPAYVSDELRPVDEVADKADRDFNADDAVCESGYCFL